jgi:antitoxin ChpS
MPTTTLKKAGGSLVMTVPASIRDAMDLSEGQRLSVAVDNGKIVLEPTTARKRYTLDELLAQCDFDQPYGDEERAWLDAPPAGRELL